MTLDPASSPPLHLFTYFVLDAPVRFEPLFFFLSLKFSKVMFREGVNNVEEGLRPCWNIIPAVLTHNNADKPEYSWQIPNMAACDLAVTRLKTVGQLRQAVWIYKPGMGSVAFPLLSICFHWMRIAQYVSTDGSVAIFCYVRRPGWVSGVVWCCMCGHCLSPVF